MFKPFFYLSLVAFVVTGCSEVSTKSDADSTLKTEKYISIKGVDIQDPTDFEWKAETVADLGLYRYQIPASSWNNLDVQKRTYVYYLGQAGLAGRDMMWDQNYRYNLEIREALEAVYTNSEDKSSDEFNAFKEYTKRVWFSNGIHHHYSMMKFTPEFSKTWFGNALQEAKGTISEEALQAMFDSEMDSKKVELDPKKGLLESSAVNFYAPDISTAEAEAFYADMIDRSDKRPIEYGLNSRLYKDADGTIKEDVYKVGGLYGPALERVVFWLEKAEKIAETPRKATALRKLIQYYKTGDLKIWDDYNIQWAAAVEGDVDYINGFIEVYNDPLGYRGSYETVVEINDVDASGRMKVLMDNVQWFEDNSPFLPEHKKDKVVGVSYKVVNVASEAGDASPSTPIGVNLPNSNWIRAQYGSKSVSLGNIVYAYSKAGGSGMLKEFSNDEEEIAMAEKYGDAAGKMHTALHEVVGHASGKLEEGVGTPKETLKSYASTIEEGRADLVALYFMLDNKLVEYGLMESTDVGRAEYDSYIRNGMLAQLRRLEKGADIEEAHMRNRAWIAHWVVEKGGSEVIEKLEREGNIFYNIVNYEKLQGLFGELLQKVQTIKSQGDYAAAEALVEGYGVKVNQDVHQQVLDRSSKLKSPAYGGFVNPVLEAVVDKEGNITDVEVNYGMTFEEQMLFYSDKYGHLRTGIRK
ncbi:MAG: dihydrofolate reductase [Flavobacteriales bacterium]|jgi:dipeptidyl-peptidase-3|tara:strand:- start:669 stop:2750 length:2082 start_codon:yes stop_codon:yes gene_type:complete